MQLLFDSLINEKIMEEICRDETADIIENDHPLKKKRKRKERTVDLWQTSWGKLIRGSNIKNENSWEAKKFKRRFRMPYEVFVEHVEECQIYDIFLSLKSILA
jgi:hypothetical protein